MVVNNYKDNAKKQQVVQNLNRCTGETVESIDHYATNLIDQVTTKDPDAVILTGSSFMLTKPDTRLVFAPEIELVRTLRIPLLGICFGHQLIGTAFGSMVVDLGESIRDIKQIRLLSRDPIFRGLPETVNVAESHRQALNNVPDGFRLLAESSTCKVEAISEQNRMVYGFQFHPERSDDTIPWGRRIIQNFLGLADSYQ
ncbi:MAG TPA: gamma-glutamyl-gamma-aminobutyrate hydrolase family protein [Candidatus Bathyarchaeia archaeon]|nr:gamma-glutamyl-gamma-aminobutyrate hydrolase family protein [Candidatus Bathyarchaeia archaeon]